MFNAKMQHRASIPSGPGHSKVLSHGGNMKGMTSRHANNSEMYRTQTGQRRIESKENPLLFGPTTKTKNTSNYQKQQAQTGPNSARGQRNDFATSGQVINRKQAFVQNSLNRTQSINLGSRAGSIDKKLKNQAGKFINPSQMLKGNKPADIKTQSLILSKNIDIQQAFQTTKNTKFFNNDFNAQKSKKTSSIIHNDLDDTE